MPLGSCYTVQAGLKPFSSAFLVLELQVYNTSTLATYASESFCPFCSETKNEKESGKQALGMFLETDLGLGSSSLVRCA